MKLLTHLFAFAALLFFPALALADVDAAFVPLTNIPGLLDAGTTVVGPEGLSTFLNNIYRICIGAAAVIAVLQIMRAGIMYMGGDSVTEKKDAKNLIALSVGGLILVLSPVIVFSIINPRILDLKIEGINLLKVEEPARIADDSTRESTIAVYDSSMTRAEMKTDCAAKSGVIVFTCTPKTGGDGRTVPESELCLATENSSGVCRRTEPGPLPTACNVSDYTYITESESGICNGTLGFEPIGLSCCRPLKPGAQCCGSKVRRIDVAGQFMSKLVARTQTEISAFENACRSFVILPELRDIVSSRNYFAGETTFGSDASRTLYCESRAHDFYEYRLIKKLVDNTVIGPAWVPEEERKDRTYRNGCSLDNGTHQVQKITDWGRCSADMSKRVFDSLTASDVTEDNYRIECRAQQTRCIKR